MGAGGRPPLFKSAEELHNAVEAYFESSPFGQYTVTGIALFLGFESRQSFYDYEKHEEYSYIIRKARLRVENGYENKLFTNSPTGAIFALKNMGWTDKIEQHVEHAGSMTFGGIQIINPDAGKS